MMNSCLEGNTKVGMTVKGGYCHYFLFVRDLRGLKICSRIRKSK